MLIAKVGLDHGDDNRNSGCRIDLSQTSDIVISADVTLLQLGYSNKMRIYLYGSNSYVELPDFDLSLNQKVRINKVYKNVQEGTYFPVFTLNSNKVKIENIQIEQNTVATNYVEHKEQIFTFPLGNEKLMLGDYLADDGIHHVRKQITLTGNETITINNVGEAKQFFKVILQDKSYVDNNIVPNALSNYYIAIQNSTSYFSEGKFTISSSGDLVICDTVHTSVQDFQNYLSNNSIVFQYVLAEETVTPYTSAQQEVYNQIKQALSYEEQTNISGTSDGSNPIFNVEVYQNTKLVLQDISNAIVALGGV